MGGQLQQGSHIQVSDFYFSLKILYYFGDKADKINYTLIEGGLL